MGNPKRTKGQRTKGQKDISTDTPIHLCALILELFWADRHISTGTCVYLYRHTLISHLPYSFFYLPTLYSLYLRYKKELRGYSPKLFRDFTCKPAPRRCIFASRIDSGRESRRCSEEQNAFCSPLVCTSLAPRIRIRLRASAAWQQKLRVILK